MQKRRETAPTDENEAHAWASFRVQKVGLVDVALGG